MNLLEKQISCDRTILLIRKILNAGFIMHKGYSVIHSKTGTPQGSVLSPVLSNIVLHELDKFVQLTIVPKYTVGKRRPTNPEYNK